MAFVPKNLVGLRKIGRLRAVQLKPDSVIVLQTKEKLSDERREGIRRAMRSLFDGYRCLVLDGGVSLGVITPRSS